jgi:uncharacterized protein YndB with AHSA1/START domain
VEYEASAVIKAPIDVVWDALIDVEGWPEWSKSMTSVQRLDDGPFGVGGKARIKQPAFPALVWEVDELEPPVSFTWSTRSVGVRTVAEHRLSNDGGAVTLVLTIRQTGPLAGVVGRLTARRGRRYLAWEADAHKRRAESGLGG